MKRGAFLIGKYKVISVEAVMKSELLNQGESPGRLDSGIWARASFSVATGTQDP